MSALLRRSFIVIFAILGGFGLTCGTFAGPGEWCSKRTAISTGLLGLIGAAFLTLIETGTLMEAAGITISIERETACNEDVRGRVRVLLAMRSAINPPRSLRRIVRPYYFPTVIVTSIILLCWPISIVETTGFIVGTGWDMVDSGGFSASVCVLLICVIVGGWLLFNYLFLYVVWSRVVMWFCIWFYVYCQLEALEP
ncbi:hypothetical protein BKA62DRAFT_719401 [Auriculariales sp. MPI-PUGE-AT-0066]|nr:hypothetical protein BKA62DRAFT_719401 [Auriculariales sp. MPI-PUGE-AT-0066]